MPNGSNLVLPGAHRVQARGRVYWYAWRGGPRLWSGPIAEEAGAAVEIARQYVQARDTRPAIGTVARVCTAYLASPEWARLAHDTKRTNHEWVDHVRARFGAMSGSELANAGADVLAWIEEIEQRRGARAADRAKLVLSRICSWARAPARKLLPRDCRPTEGIEGRYRAPVQHAAPLAEVHDAIARLPERLSLALSLALNTGLRRMDLVALDWAAVDWRSGRIVWATSKGKRLRRKVVIPITPALRATLERAEPRAVGPVLRSTTGEGWSVHGLSHALRAALPALGYKWSLHDIRRACATHLASQGWSSRQIARVLGWSESEAEMMAATYVDEGCKPDVKPENDLPKTPSGPRGTGGRVA